MRFVEQDGRLQVAQLGGRIEAEILTQAPLDLSVRLERLGRRPLRYWATIRCAAN
jgi:hypothetical protein